MDEDIDYNKVPDKEEEIDDEEEADFSGASDINGVPNER